METAGVGHNRAPFDFFEFFDRVVNTLGMTSAEKLVQIVIARRAHDVGGAAVAPARADVARQASCSEATMKRSYRLLEAFFDVNKRPGKTTEYAPKSAVTPYQIEQAIAGLPIAKGAHGEPPTPTHHEPGSPRAPAHPVTGTPALHEPPQQNVPPHPLKNINITTLDWRGREGLNLLENRLLDACNGAADTAAPNLRMLVEPIRWLESGCDLEIDVLPTVRARAHKMRPGSVRNWAYFTQAVADAKAARTAPMPTGQPRAADAGRRKKTTDDMTAEEYLAHLERGGV